MERAVAEGAGCKRSEKRGNSVDVSRRSLNTLQIIYETQFEFDEEMSNPNTIKELDTSVERDDSQMIPLYTQITRPVIMILCMTAVSLYIIL